MSRFANLADKPVARGLDLQSAAEPVEPPAGKVTASLVGRKVISGHFF